MLLSEVVCQVTGCPTDTVECLSTKVTRGAHSSLSSGEGLPHLAALFTSSDFVLVVLLLNVVCKVAGGTSGTLENLSTNIARSLRSVFGPCETFPNLAPLLSQTCCFFAIVLQMDLDVFLH